MFPLSSSPVIPGGKHTDFVASSTSRSNTRFLFSSCPPTIAVQHHSPQSYRTRIDTTPQHRQLSFAHHHDNTHKRNKITKETSGSKPSIPQLLLCPPPPTITNPCPIHIPQPPQRPTSITIHIITQTATPMTIRTDIMHNLMPAPLSERPPRLLDPEIAHLASSHVVPVVLGAGAEG